MSSPVDPRKVWLVLSQIPPGKVVTYGQLAQLAEAPGCARIIGSLLKQLPESAGLPWHRVINCKGRISFPEGSRQHLTQKNRLEQEGISLATGKVNLPLHRWNGE